MVIKNFGDELKTHIMHLREKKTRDALKIKWAKICVYKNSMDTIVLPEKRTRELYREFRGKLNNLWYEPEIDDVVGVVMFKDGGWLQKIDGIWYHLYKPTKPYGL